jgi:hypothetical protein
MMQTHAHDPTAAWDQLEGESVEQWRNRLAQVPAESLTPRQAELLTLRREQAEAQILRAQEHALLTESEAVAPLLPAPSPALEQAKQAYQALTGAQRKEFLLWLAEGADGAEEASPSS